MVARERSELRDGGLYPKMWLPSAYGKRKHAGHYNDYLVDVVRLSMLFSERSEHALERVYERARNQTQLVAAFFTLQHLVNLVALTSGAYSRSGESEGPQLLLFGRLMERISRLKEGERAGTPACEPPGPA